MEPLGPKLRLMISYNGHIIPRPHDKTLTYVGGETRIFTADRRSSLSSLSDRLSKTLNTAAKPFTLKYQLPNEDLDSLISLSTDEDFENLIEEYDKIAKRNSPGRIRVFLFPTKLESLSSIGSFMEASSKSEDWFMTILNGSDSGSVGQNDENMIGKVASKETEEKLEQLVETTSSFGSGASSSPIRGQTEDKTGHTSMSDTAGNSNLVFLDDEKSEQGIVHSQWKQNSVDLISPDSASSESRTTNQMTSPLMYPDKTTVYPVDPFQVQQFQDAGYVQMDHQNQYNTVLEQQKYPPHQQQQQQFLPFNPQQQFVRPGPQYIRHPSGGVVPAGPYFYPPQEQNRPLIFLPPGQAQMYNLPTQQPKQEMVNTIYRTATMPYSSQDQPQYANISQIRYSSQSIPSPSPMQFYYGQPPASQYPNMAFSGLGPNMILPTDNVKHHSTTSQP